MAETRMLYRSQATARWPASVAAWPSTSSRRHADPDPVRRAGRAWGLRDRPLPGDVDHRSQRAANRWSAGNGSPHPCGTYGAARPGRTLV